MIKTMSNRNIYSIGLKLDSFFNSETLKTKYLPAKINFLIQKNKQELFKICNQLEKVREDVIRKYGEVDETNSTFTLPNEVTKQVNNELDELLDLTQKINISMIKLSDLEGLEFTLEQMDALMFMIEE